ncbi:bL17 family ribosomal protein [Thalassoglobus polymorphus]|uniref:Large ribosomal subunit protein bL17 n=1 Tax=Thalassoglobus polymorphus TaxID=2527994 RepID=A0A517QSE9_9PLAN|nr:bL17 family ribosomal protein [Thalassoglobus polymorphus]QDT34559.1 50S ribosomal protein L17 [Thalassoglobus polymorphus]
MRHRMSGRKLGRNASHRRAMFRNMAASLIKTVRADEGDEGAPKVQGRIVTTVAKAKELRPYVEKLVTLAKKAQKHEEKAEQYATTAERNTSEWKSWRGSDQWNQWNQAIAPAIDYRRRAFALLRDKDAVDILFSELGERFADRNGGYTRIVRLAKVRLGDAGEQALIEFVGVRDRVKITQTAPVVVDDEEPADEGSSVEGESESTEQTESPEAEASEETPEVEASSEETDSEEAKKEE